MNEITAHFVVLFLSVFVNVDANYTSFVDSGTKEIGLRNSDGSICLSLTFHVSLVNYNIEGDDNELDFDLLSSNISGRCSTHLMGDAMLSSTILNGERKKKLKFYFHATNVFIKQYEELRWQLRRVVYVETFNNQSAVFESSNSSIVMSAPLNQKFVCNDKLNISLTIPNSDYKKIVVVFHPEIDAQPFGLKSNLYVCERTRKRTLSESFETKTTVFSGIVLALSSMAVIIGHSVRRHMIPERKEQYLNLERMNL